MDSNAGQPNCVPAGCQVPECGGARFGHRCQDAQTSPRGDHAQVSDSSVGSLETEVGANFRKNYGRVVRDEVGRNTTN
eukprot:7722959-Lingulodinium_polyedra.AAC.1